MIRVGDRVEVVIRTESTPYTSMYGGHRGSVVRLCAVAESNYAWIWLDGARPAQAFFLADLKVLNPVEAIARLA